MTFTNKAFTWIELLVVLVIIGVLVLLLLPVVETARPASQCMQCANNLKQLGLAMHNYHDEYGCLPPAYVADENGKPMHSWRTLLLPYMEQKALYDQYNFDEPWDSPANQVVVGSVIDCLRCPSAKSNLASGQPLPENRTCYVMITGPGMFSEGENCVTTKDIADGTSNTIMIVEIRNSDIAWAEPRDLRADELWGINNESDERPSTLGSEHHGGMNVLICDGSVRFMPATITPERLRALLTIAGGEKAEDF